MNAREDDIEVLQPPRKMRQAGYEQGSAFCSEEKAGFAIAGLVSPVPFKGDFTEWATTMQFGTGIAALKFRFNPRAGLYEWVETGPSRVGNEEFVLSEPTMARVDGAWLIAVRPRHLDPARAGVTIGVGQPLLHAPIGREGDAVVDPIRYGLG